MVNFDLRVGREFRLHERARLEFNAEAFNLFNHTNFFSVNTTQYNFTVAGSGVCAGHANACVAANPAFLTPTASSNNLYGARQLQIVGRFSF